MGEDLWDALRELRNAIEDDSADDATDSDPPVAYESSRGRDVAAARASCSAISDASTALARR